MSGRCVFFFLSPFSFLFLGEMCLKCVERMRLVGFVSIPIRNKLLQRCRIHSVFFCFFYYGLLYFSSVHVIHLCKSRRDRCKFMRSVYTDKKKKIHTCIWQKKKIGFVTIHFLGDVSATSFSKACSDVNNLLDIAVALLYNDRGYDQAFTQQVRI